MVRIYFEDEKGNKSEKFVDVYFSSILKSYILCAVSVFGIMFGLLIVLGLIFNLFGL